MKEIRILIYILAVILFILLGCEEKDYDDFSVSIILINDLGKQTNSFKEGDVLTFKFYLTNHSGKEAIYIRPCGEFGEYLKVYKKDNLDVYQYFGQPVYYCPLIAFTDTIIANETILLTSVPWLTEYGCPELPLGNYFVGDTLTLHINDENYGFTRRIYFDIH